MEYGCSMSGWGRFSFLIGVGVVLGAGCGGRTGALDSDYNWGADGGGAEAGSVSSGGTSSVAGRTGRGGRGNVAGNAATAGAPSFGGYGTGGAVVYPVAGYAGTYSFGGSYPGAGFAGYFPTGGSYPTAGSYPVGGYGGYSFGGFGGYAFGGFGGQPQDACGPCLLRACAAPLTECLQDFGCIAILSCVQSRGCEAFECYSDQFCKGVIDQWGGPAGESMSTILQTFSCAVKSGCPCN